MSVSHCLSRVFGAVSLLLLSGISFASGASVQRYGERVLLVFPEPVVSRSAVEAPPEASEAERGLDVLLLSGDEQHRPEMRWSDQDTLELTAAEGTVAGLPYQVRLKPGTTYLSGAAAAQEVTEFCYAPPALHPLAQVALPQGGGIVLGTAPAGRVLPPAPLSTDSQRCYTFAEQKEETFARHPRAAAGGRTVSAHAEPVFLRHGMSRELLAHLAQSKVDFSALRGDTPLPGCVLVVPDEALPEGSCWSLAFTEADGYAGGENVDILVASRSLKTALLQGELTADEAAQADAGPPLVLRFSDAVRREDVESLFRRMELRAGAPAAAPQDSLPVLFGAAEEVDGKLIRRACLDGQEITVSLLPAGAETDDETKTYAPDGTTWSYAAPGMARSMAMAVRAAFPCTLELGLPAGSLETPSGLRLEKSVAHRMTLFTQGPVVDVRNGQRVPPLLRLPRYGDRSLRLMCGGSSRLQAQAYYWSPDAVVENRRALAELMRLQQSCPKSASYEDALEEARLKAGLIKSADAVGPDDEPCKLRRRYEQALAARVKSAQSFPAQERALPDTGRLATAEQQLSLDDLTGGPAAPGLYLLRLKAEASPTAAAAAAALGLAAEEVAEWQDVFVMVSNLNLRVRGGAVFVNALSDGSIPEQGEAYASDGEQAIPLLHGFAELPLMPRGEEEDAFLVLRSGDDVGWGLLPRSGVAPVPGERLQAELLTDRPLYRPGETVHLFGLLRRVNGGHSQMAQQPLVLTWRGPDNRVLATRTVTPDSYGSFEDAFALPQGEEDVTGNFRCSVALQKGASAPLSNVSVRSEVFRRDSFELKLETELPALYPDSYRCVVTARDYNGTPLAGARVELRLHGGLHLEGGKEDRGQCFLQKTLYTGADGTASFSCAVRELCSEEERDTLSASLRTEVTASNDREEVQRASAVNKAHFADCFLLCYGSRLCLYRQARDAEEALQPVETERTLHGELIAKQEKKQPLGGGFSQLKEENVVLWSGEITFPAHDSAGVELPCPVEEWTRRYGSLELVLRGRDGADRPYRHTERFWSWSFRLQQDSLPLLLCTHKEGTCFEVDSPLAGEVGVVAVSAAGQRCLSRQLVKGKQELHLPEIEDWRGAIVVSFLMPQKDEAGLHTVLSGNSVCYFRPDEHRALSLETDCPADAVAPGSELTLHGRVTRRADGRPAQARVLLFAVDAGMLSAAGADGRLPEWERLFAVEPRELVAPLFRVFGREPMPRTGLCDWWSGLWQGEARTDGAWLPAGEESVLYPHHRTLTCMVANAAGDRAAPQLMKSRAYAAPKALAAVDIPMDAVEGEPEAGDIGCGLDDGAEKPPLRLRQSFRPLAVWAASLQTDAEGRFESTWTLPDTLTTYRVFCVAAGADGDSFGNRTDSLEVKLPVMLTAGTPFFMSTGDNLMLPLTVTNATKLADTWQVRLEGGETQSIRLDAGASATLYFRVAPQEEGTCTLRWEARAAAGGDAVEGSFPVLYPAPLLKERHHLVLAPDASAAEGTAAELAPAALLAPELAESTRGELTVTLSANPLLHLAGCADFVLRYPYGCTEQTATGLLPWLMYEQLAPFCPQMAETPAAEVAQHVQASIKRLLRRQRPDGGLGYWDGSSQSCFWASAHAALVLTYAEERAYQVPQEEMRRLRAYLAAERDKALRRREWEQYGPLVRLEVARALGNHEDLLEALEEAAAEAPAPPAAYPRPFFCRVAPDIRADVQMLQALQGETAGHHAAFLRWLRSRARDYRHSSTWAGAWALMALYEYTAELPADAGTSRVALADGRELELGKGATVLTLAGKGAALGSAGETLRALHGFTYVTVAAKARPERTEYPGVTEKGLQVTRLYETKGEDGRWHAAQQFKVGEVVRVTLTCAKAAPELRYLVLEDYLPSCMEAVNPRVPSQAAGLDFVPWSAEFDNKEYLADRVRGFCTRWEGRRLLNMVYFARVKRAGVSTAPPAQAQLMYEPQVHGLSPNARILSR